MEEPEFEPGAEMLTAGSRAPAIGLREVVIPSLQPLVPEPQVGCEVGIGSTQDSKEVTVHRVLCRQPCREGGLSASGTTLPSPVHPPGPGKCPWPSCDVLLPSLLRAARGRTWFPVCSSPAASGFLSDPRWGFTLSDPCPYLECSPGSPGCAGVSGLGDVPFLRLYRSLDLLWGHATP